MIYMWNKVLTHLYYDSYGGQLVSQIQIIKMLNRGLFRGYDSEVIHIVEEFLNE